MPNLEFRRVGVVAKPRRDLTPEVVVRLMAWLAEHGMEPVLDRTTASMVDGQDGLPRSELMARSDLVIVLGGDGTLLSVARLPNPGRAPVLAINLGDLGFLTAISLDKLDEALAALLSGDYEIAHRTMLQVSVNRQEKEVFNGLALNDVVIDKANEARLIALQTFIDGRYLTTYRADGLIIATPTGSTAYSLSAGGPIVHPGVEAFVIAPICPHTLTNRPLVVSSQAEVDVVPRSRAQPARMSLDGQVEVPLVVDDQVRVRRADLPFPLIRLHTYSYFYLLRAKLRWGQR